MCRKDRLPYREPAAHCRKTTQAFICDAIRTPIGRYGGSLATVRTDDLGAVPLRALMARNPRVDWAAVDDVIFGCANQAGEDNRNVARMSALLAGLPLAVPGSTVNRLCGSGLDAIGTAARAIKSGEAGLMIAGLGTVSGTVLTVLVNIGSSDIVKTVVLAALGAVVSFSVSVLLKWLVKKFK